jgi:DNA-binding IclR family transcriptional regulator
MTIGITVSTRYPDYATSMGRVLLAHLPPADLKAYLASVAQEIVATARHISADLTARG